MTRTLPVLIFFVLLAGFLMTGCNEGGSLVETRGLPDRFDRGTIHISCDESFKPVIDAQVAAYEALYPETKIIVHYKPEADCLRDFTVDSIRMILATRGFSPAEKQLIIDSLLLEPEQLTIARDLIAVIVHPASSDTMFNMQEIKDLLSGKAKKNLIPVFDGAKATSTVRFMLDSMLRGDSLSERVVAANSSREVISYVSRVSNAVGFVGYSWIGNMDDTAQVSTLRNVKLAYVESTDSANAYVIPSQYFIYTGTYPMVRDLVYTLKEKHIGLAHGFAHFLEKNDKGQLIFRRAYIMPLRSPSFVRDAELREKINNQ